MAWISVQSTHRGHVLSSPAMRLVVMPFLVAVAILAFAAGPVSANHCDGTAYPVYGKTVCRTTIFTPTGAGEWFATALSSPVIICNLDRVGVWQRVVDYTKSVSDKTMAECFASSWDRFLGLRGHDKRITIAAGPGDGDVAQKTETRFACTGTPPGPELPPAYSDLRTLDPPEPGLSVLIRFSTAGHGMAELPSFEGIDSTNSFATILQEIGATYEVGSAQFDSLYLELEALDGPPDEKAMFLSHFAALREHMQSVGLELRGGIPSSSSGFRELGSRLRSFAGDLVLLGAAGDPSHLLSGADALENAGDRIDAGLDDCDRRCRILLDFAAVAESFNEFGASADSEEPSGAEPSTWGALKAKFR